MPYTDTNISNLIINMLTREQYENIASPSESELYLITDDITPEPGNATQNVGVTSSAGSATQYARADHVHAISSNTISSALGYVPGEISNIVINETTYTPTGGTVNIGTLPTDLTGLSDTTITSPTDGQILVYDGTNSKWINAANNGGGGGAITYSLSISGNRITLTPSSGTATYVDLPVYDGSAQNGIE